MKRFLSCRKTLDVSLATVFFALFTCLSGPAISQEANHGHNYVREAPQTSKACVNHIFKLGDGANSLLSAGYTKKSAMWGLTVYFKTPSRPKGARSAPYRVELHSGGHLCEIKFGGDKKGPDTLQSVEKAISSMGFRKTTVPDHQGKPKKVWAKGERIFRLVSLERRSSYGEISSEFAFRRQGPKN